MASIDKASVREKFEEIKQSFSQSCKNESVPVAVKVQFESMFLLFELILSIFLEKTTSKTSKNSSKASSQTDKDESALDSLSGSKGKGKKEKRETFAQSRTRETVRLSQVHECNICGEDLSKVPCICHERRTKIDIVFEKVVEHVDAEVKECPICDSEVRGSFPSDMSGPLQYGDGLKAYVITMLVHQMVAIKRVQNLVATLIGETVSEISMLRYILRLNAALEEWEAAMRQQLLNALVIHTDETSLRVERKNYWIHVYSSGGVTLKYLHKKRGKEAIEDIGIVPLYGGTIVHDCWASYLSYDHLSHGLCGSHILRELTFIIDSNNYQWAKNMKQLLQETCALVSKRNRKKLTVQEYQNLQKRYRNIMTRGEKELPSIPAKPRGKRGKIAKSDAHNLWERLREHEAAVLLFAKQGEVAFTNNRAERDLRMSKVKQKVSGCFRSEKYAHAYCRISSYLQTMANAGHNPLIAIQMALSGELTPKNLKSLHG